MHCWNCGAYVYGNYCSTCGEKQDDDEDEEGGNDYIELQEIGDQARLDPEPPEAPLPDEGGK